MLAELKEDSRRRLTVIELELTENVSKASQSLLDTMSEISDHSQSVKSVKLTIWVTNASSEVNDQLTQVQDST